MWEQQDTPGPASPPGTSGRTSTAAGLYSPASGEPEAASSTFCILRRAFSSGSFNTRWLWSGLTAV